MSDSDLEKLLAVYEQNGRERIAREWLQTVRTEDNGGKFSDAVKRHVWARDEGRCQECGVAVVPQVDAEYDHILPWWYGGSGSERNCQVLCAPCNKRKGCSLDDDYLGESRELELMRKIDDLRRRFSSGPYLPLV
jgi:5-methylcytosine-specific restriction endonuclease McrA